eukprot:GHRR01013975.1.p1 GENE.GHRR01013975.1~~GHRR01013975.1.p1  ORF type:complete len:117 (+),score=36.58 GHRR01013975.1:748-1098(+)
MHCTFIGSPSCISTQRNFFIYNVHTCTGAAPDFACRDEDYNMITRGRLLDRMRVAIAGSTAVKLVLGEDTNFAIADIKRIRKMAERFVFYYGMSNFGITTWAQQPYSHDFAVGSHR